MRTTSDHTEGSRLRPDMLLTAELSEKEKEFLLTLAEEDIARRSG